MLSERLIQLSRPSRGGLLGALVLTAAMGMYRWVLQPHTVELAAAERYEGLMETIAGRNESSAKLLGAKERKLKQLTARYERLSACLFTSAEVKSFCSDLPKLAAESGCAVHSLNFVPVRVTGDERRGEQQSKISSRQFRLVFSGQYTGTVEMMGKLRGYEPVIFLDSVNIELAAGGMLKSDINITIYVMGERGGLQ
jgi:hypothetical protein